MIKRALLRYYGELESYIRLFASNQKLLSVLILQRRLQKIWIHIVWCILSGAVSPVCVVWHSKTRCVLYSNRFLKQKWEIAGYILFLFNILIFLVIFLYLSHCILFYHSMNCNIFLLQTFIFHLNIYVKCWFKSASCCLSNTSCFCFVF